MEIVAIIGTTACVVVALGIMILTVPVVLYNGFKLYQHSQRAGQPPRGQVARAAQPVAVLTEGRNPYYTPVIIVNDGPGKDFYAVLVFVPPGHDQTNAMRPEFLRAINGLAGYRIVTERVALEVMGKRFGGFAYLSELDVPKVV